MKKKGKYAATLAVVAVSAGLMAPSASADPNPYKDLCKDGGYQLLGFQNQGQCVAAVNHGYTPPVVGND